ncbi:hypothetical protein ACFW04_007741 [Cataglyphis niger]
MIYAKVLLFNTFFFLSFMLFYLYIKKTIIQFFNLTD